jgi:hypothetical protein
MRVPRQIQHTQFQQGHHRQVANLAGTSNYPETRIEGDFVKRIVASLALPLGWLSIGCGHAQVKPSTHTLQLTWQAPANGGTPPYSYIMSRITLQAGSSTCPAANTTAPNYTPLNSSAPVSSLAYTDTSASGLTVCYIVQAQDSAKAVGNPSNTAGPYVVPTIPGTPVTLGGSVTASLDMPQPALPKPSAGPDAPAVVAKLEGRLR